MTRTRRLPSGLFLNYAKPSGGDYPTKNALARTRLDALHRYQRIENRNGAARVPRNFDHLADGQASICRERRVIDDLETISWQIRKPRWPVRQQHHLAYTDIAQNLRADAVVAEVGLGGIETRRRAMRQPAFAAVDIVRKRIPFALEVQDHALPRRSNVPHRGW